MFSGATYNMNAYRWLVREFVYDLFIMPMTIAAAFAAFLAVKGVECRQRWARILGTIVAVSTMTLFPGQVLWYIWRVDTGQIRHESIWETTDRFWFLLSVPCLILGAIALFAMWRMRTANSR